MNVAVRTAGGVFLVDVEAEEVLGLEPGLSVERAPEPAGLALPLLRTSDAYGSTIVAVVRRRPPLAVSYDAGRTWRESGGGLPAGRAVAISRETPDHVVYASRNRLYLSTDGGRFWHGLAPELPEIEDLVWVSPGA